MRESTSEMEKILKAFRIVPDFHNFTIDDLRHEAKIIADAAKELGYSQSDGALVLTEYIMHSQTEITLENLTEATCSTLRELGRTVDRPKYNVNDVLYITKRFIGSSEYKENPISLAEATCKTLKYGKDKDLSISALSQMIESAKERIQRKQDADYEQKKAELRTKHKGLRYVMHRIGAIVSYCSSQDIGCRQLSEAVTQPEKYP